MNILNFFKIKKYKVVAVYDNIEYSECERTGKRKIEFFYSIINSSGNLEKVYGRNPNRNYTIDYDYLSGNGSLPRSPKELRGDKPIPKR